MCRVRLIKYIMSVYSESGGVQVGPHVTKHTPYSERGRHAVMQVFLENCC